jgi:predicted regulator of Ras-like GTPase activity (Roadblock/LC7/MglB family)
MFDNLSIFEDDFWAINERLASLLSSTNALTVLLIDRAGQLITSAGDTSKIDMASFASLSAADYAATSQLASLLGEQEFKTLFHQGESENIYVSLVGKKVILVVIFDRRSTLGLVRLRVARAAKELAGIFDSIFAKLERPTRATAGIDADFASEAGSVLDDIFG